MSRFCVYVNKNKPTQNNIPYMLDVQADTLQKLQTVVCIPLVAPTSIMPISLLNPKILIDDQPYVLMTQAMSAIARQQLGKQVKDCNPNSYQIVAALDFLLSGC
jgi:toxin CcdB